MLKFVLIFFYLLADDTAHVVVVVVVVDIVCGFCITLTGHVATKRSRQKHFTPVDRVSLNVALMFVSIPSCRFTGIEQSASCHPFLLSTLCGAMKTFLCR